MISKPVAVGTKFMLDTSHSIVLARAIVEREVSPGTTIVSHADPLTILYPVRGWI